MGIPYGILRIQMAEPLNPAERVRERLKQWMDTTKIGQRELAKDLGKSQVWLQKVLAGQNEIRLRHLDDVARALRTSARELVRGEEDRYSFELGPTEVRIVEKLRHRPKAKQAIADLLDIELQENESGVLKSSTKKKRT